MSTDNDNNTHLQSLKDRLERRAKAAAEYAILSGVDPRVVIDAGLRELERFRIERLGEAPEHVAHDPLARLVRDVRHGRFPAEHLDVLRTLLLAACNNDTQEYSDSHKRKTSMRG